MTYDSPLNNAYLLLGSNEGNRLQWLQEALKKIAHNGGNILKQSSLYETKAWGIAEQPDFLNMVVYIETTLQAIDLLHNIQDIENMLGRQRAVKWGQRTLDIDILFYNAAIINLPELTVPHPFLQDRRFTLAPLAEIAPQMMHPVLHKTMQELLDVCTDTLTVNRLNRDLWD